MPSSKLRRIPPPLVALGIFLLIGIGFAISYFVSQKPGPAPLEYSLETTFLTGPVEADGRIDYEWHRNRVSMGDIEPRDNAMTLIVRAIGPKPEGKRLHADWWSLLGCEEPPEEGDYFKVRSQEAMSPAERERFADASHFGQLRELRMQDQVRLSSAPWKRADEPEWAAWLASIEKPLALVAEASSKPIYFHPIISRLESGERGMMYAALLPYMQKIRVFAEPLCMRAMLHAGEGRFDDAWRDLHALDRLGALIQRNPCCLVEGLVGLALQDAAMTAMARLAHALPPNVEETKAILAKIELASASWDWGILVGVGERFNLLDSAFAMKIHPGNIEGWFPDFGRAVAQAKSDRLDWNAVFGTINREVDAIVADLSKPRGPGSPAAWKYDASRFDEPDADLLAEDFRAGSEHFGKVLVNHFQKGFDNILRAEQRSKQRRAFLAIALELTRHRAANGEYPESLAKLGKPESGAIYERTELGYRLRSKGKKGIDDLGKNDDAVISVP